MALFSAPITDVVIPNVKGQIEIVWRQYDFDTGEHTDHMVFANSGTAIDLYHAAEQLYKKILRQGPNPFVYAKLAEVSRAAGRFFEVAEYLEKAVEIEPDNNSYLANLGTGLISTGRPQQGIERHGNR